MRPAHSRPLPGPQPASSRPLPGFFPHLPGVLPVGPSRPPPGLPPGLLRPPPRPTPGPAPASADPRPGLAQARLAQPRAWAAGPIGEETDDEPTEPLRPPVRRDRPVRVAADPVHAGIRRQSPVPPPRPRSRENIRQSARGSSRQPGRTCGSARGPPQHAAHRQHAQPDRGSPRFGVKTSPIDARIGATGAKTGAIARTDPTALEAVAGRIRPELAGLHARKPARIHPDWRPSRPTRCCAHGQHRLGGFAALFVAHAASVVLAAPAGVQLGAAGRGCYPVHPAGSLDVSEGIKVVEHRWRGGDSDSLAAHAALSRPEGPGLHTNGTIEVDVEGTTGLGPSIGFHRRDRATHELFYLRPNARLRHEAGLRPVRAGDEERAAVGHLS